MENFAFQYPSWLFLVCIAAGIAYSLFLYYKARSFDGKHKWLKITLGALRFASVALIAILLLGPLFKTTEKDTKRPAIAILQDKSKSVGQWMGTSQEAYKAGLNQLISALSETFEVDFYTFDTNVDQVSIDSLRFDGDQTNISNAIEYISDIYEGDNLGAVILATDGLYNDGKNPIYSYFNHPSALYGIALGDTTRKNDLILKRVLYNELAYLGDQLTIQADIVASGSQGNKTTLTVQRRMNDSYVNVYSKNININSDNFFTSEAITLNLDQVGIVQYRFILSPLNNESNRQNNIRDIYIEVLDARQSILIIAHAPHPDLAAIKQMLERNKNYEVQIRFDIPEEKVIAEADMVIFHSLPSKRLSIQSMVKRLDQNKIPRIYITGIQTDLEAFNRIQSGITIKGQNQVFSQAQGTLKEGFNSYSISDELKRRVQQYPPLSVPFGEYRTSRPLSTLINQKIGNVSTDYPLLAFDDQEGLKTAYLLGEGIWKWKYYDFAESGNFDVVGELIDKSILYSTTVEDKRKFRVSTSETIYPEYEDVLFTAELYNNSYELVNESEVTMTLYNQANQEFKYTFYPEGNRYALNSGKLLPGEYRYKAATSYGGESFEASGRFSVREIQYELYDLEANPTILNTLSQKSNGEVFSAGQIEDLILKIEANENLKPVIYLNQTTKSVLDFKWIFALLTVLLGVEWFLRRYFGSI